MDFSLFIMISLTVSGRVKKTYFMCRKLLYC